MLTAAAWGCRIIRHPRGRCLPTLRRHLAERQSITGHFALDGSRSAADLAEGRI
jgi:hypothetical protein